MQGSCSRVRCNIEEQIPYTGKISENHWFIEEENIWQSQVDAEIIGSVI